jgi:hypothetical protein
MLFVTGMVRLGPDTQKRALHRSVGSTRDAETHTLQVPFDWQPLGSVLLSCWISGIFQDVKDGIHSGKNRQ